MIHTFAIFQVCHFTVRIFYSVHYYFWLMLKNFCMLNLFGIYLYIHICNCGHLWINCHNFYFWKINKQKNSCWMQLIIFHLHTYVKVYIVNKINIHIEIDRSSGVFLCFFKRPQKQWSYMPRGTRVGCREFISLHEFIWNVYWLREKVYWLNLCNKW